MKVLKVRNLDKKKTYYTVDEDLDKYNDINAHNNKVEL